MDNYLDIMGRMENTWKEAVDRALTVREDQLTTAQLAIQELQQQLQQTMVAQQSQGWEAEELKRVIADQNEKLVLAHEHLNDALESSKRALEENSRYYQSELESKERELEETRNLHKQSIIELTTGAKQALLELETDLDKARENEQNLKSRIIDLEEINSKHEKHLRDWNKVSDKMSTELNEVKGQLKSSKYANMKMKEELGLWKKYCEKIQEEKRAVNRGVELEKQVLNKFNHIDSFMRSERQLRNTLMEGVNRMGKDIRKDLQRLQTSNSQKVVLAAVSCQTDVSNEEEEEIKNSRIAELEKRETILEEELVKCQMDLGNLMQQNGTLKEVIKGMKGERERMERERERAEEEERVAKLEENVRLLKNNLLNEKRDVCVWSALQDVKKEVSNLKNKSLHKNINKETEDKVPGMVIRPLRK